MIIPSPIPEIFYDRGDSLTRTAQRENDPAKAAKGAITPEGLSSGAAGGGF